MTHHALWQRLDTPGHDAASLSRTDTGWRLEGTAVFLHPSGPARLAYAVDLDPDWKARQGQVQGWIGNRRADALITRQGRTWLFNGQAADGLDHLDDLDFGFTPATNLPHFRRAALAVGAATDWPVVWLDDDVTTLVELPQRFERRSELTYRYDSPSVSYQATLELAGNGFVSRYPTLWELEAAG